VKNSERLLKLFEKPEPEEPKDFLAPEVFDAIMDLMSEGLLGMSDNFLTKRTIFPISVDAEWKNNDDEKQ